MEIKTGYSPQRAGMVYRPAKWQKRKDDMSSLLAHNWWMVALRGLVAMLFGLTALLLPDITLTVLVLLFGAYVLLDGVLTIAAGIANRAGEERWWVLLEGITGAVIGVAIIIWPGIKEFVLLYLIALWAIVTGILEILTAIELRKEIEGKWFLALSGLVSLILGVLVALQPAAGVLAIIWMLRLYAIVFGVLLLLLAFRLRDVNNRLDSRVPYGR